MRRPVSSQEEQVERPLFQKAASAPIGESSPSASAVFRGANALALVEFANAGSRKQLLRKASYAILKA
jgi:hypothetical protein